MPLAPLRVGLVTSEGSAAEADFLDELRRSGFAFRVLRADSRVQGFDAPRSIASRDPHAGHPPARRARPRARRRRPHRPGRLRRRGGGAGDRRRARCPCSPGSATRSTPRWPTRWPTPSAKTPTACAQLLVARVGELAGALEGTWAAIAEQRRARRAAPRRAAAAARPPPGARHARRARRRRGPPRRRSPTARAEPRWPASIGPATASTATAVASPARPARTSAPPRCWWPPASAASPTARRERWPRPSGRSSSVEARLRALDPDRTLARGWSITRGPDGSVVRSPADVQPGDAAHHPRRRRRRALYGVAPMSDEEIGYADALAELEAILEEIEDDAVDVDVLAAKVKRGAELLRICRGRITAAKVEVTQIVAELDPDADDA